ncbi:hypothetical protein RHGRI_017469 [Rhododendron griersonianum]|uniref:Uncharacterized protein n=1 Tax=Rhododendron griersonianum TaxID=479676 RepID=A0AAV6JY13_9ERIC|nr:hypothetical protein RHGRI_017469 [Rhododendron griersonianum]
MVCSRKPTSSTASLGPTLPPSFSPAGRPYVHGDPSFDANIDPSFDATIDLSLSSPHALSHLLGERQLYDKISQKYTPHRVSRKSYRFVFEQGVRVS